MLGPDIIRFTAASAALGLTALAVPAFAQLREPVPIEVVIGAGDFSPRCLPDELRLPARTPIRLRLDNRGTLALVFRAPGFLERANILDDTGAVTARGPVPGYIVAPGTTDSITMVTPAEGRYPFACTEPAEVPPVPTGVILVIAGRGPA